MGQGSLIKISSSPASRIEAGCLQSTIALQVNNDWLGGKPLFVSHPNEIVVLDMKPLLIRWQTTIAIALTLYRFAHALWWLFFPIA